MSDFGQLCRAIEAREKLVRSLAEWERRLSGLPWYRWKQRRAVQQRIADVQAGIQEQNSKITPQAALDMANSVGAILWERAASAIIPKKNSYGPAARERLDELLDTVLEMAKDYVTCQDDRPFLLSALPEVNSLLTRDFARTKVEREMDDREAIAASPEIIHEYCRDYEGKQVLMVQHVASGMRAKFTLYGDGFGSVGSKPFELHSIDPANPGPLYAWEQVVGLGIGPRIYKEAERLEPNVRWHKGGTLSDYSRPLRRKLHAADPYTWNGPCKWCDENLLPSGFHHWSEAGEAFFSNHP